MAQVISEQELNDVADKLFAQDEIDAGVNTPISPSGAPASKGSEGVMDLITSALNINPIDVNNINKSNMKSSTELRRTTKSEIIDSPLAQSFDDTMVVINEGVAEAADLRAEGEKIAKDTASLHDLTAVAVRNQVGDAQTIRLAEDTAELKAQNDSAAVAEAIGADPKTLSKLSTEYKSALEVSLEKQKIVEENVNVDFTDDPLQYIANRFTIRDQMEEANVAAATAGKYKSAIANITGLASTVDKTFEDLKVTTTEATIAANSSAIAKQANLAAIESLKKANDSNALRVRESMDANQTEMATRVTQYRLGVQKVTDEELAKQRKSTQTALDQKMLSDSDYAKAVIRGRQKIGVPVYTGNDPETLRKQESEITLERSIKGEQSDRVNNLFQLGIGTVDPTPFQTLESIDLSDQTALLDDKNMAFSALKDSYDESVQALNEAGVKVTRESLSGAVNDTFLAKMKRYEKSIDSRDDRNPNRAKPLAYLLTAESVKDEKLTGILTGLLSDDVKDIKADKVVAVAFSSVKTKYNPDGTITFEEALSGINAIYSLAIDQNNIGQDRENRGIPLQENYNARMKRAGIDLPIEKMSGRLVSSMSAAFTSTTVDLTDPVALAELGLRILAPSQTEAGAGLLDIDNRINRTQEK